MFSKNPMFEMVGYEEKTTIWADFSIAERFGEKHIRETYQNELNNFNGKIVEMTELAMVLNHKLWLLHELKNPLAKTYHELWVTVDGLIFEMFKDDKEAIRYYLKTTD